MYFYIYIYVYIHIHTYILCIYVVYLLYIIYNIVSGGIIILSNWAVELGQFFWGAKANTRLY